MVNTKETSKLKRSIFGRIIDRLARVEEREARAANSTPAVQAAMAPVIAREQRSIDEYYEKLSAKTGVKFPGHTVDSAMYGEVLLSRGRPEEILIAAVAGVRITHSKDRNGFRPVDRFLLNVRNSLFEARWTPPNTFDWVSKQQTERVNAALKCGVTFDEKAMVWLSPYKLVADSVGVHIQMPVRAAEL